MEPTDSADKGLHMPTCINRYEAGLRRSSRLKATQKMVLIEKLM